MKLIAISGSLRKASLNTKLLELVKAQAADIPLYNGDVEAAGLPAAVTNLSAKIRAADALYLATPEYNYGTSGVLKNTIDWLSRDREPSMPLGGKVCALAGTSAGMLGTASAQAHLRHTLALLGCGEEGPRSQIHCEPADNGQEPCFGDAELIVKDDQLTAHKSTAKAINNRDQPADNGEDAISDIICRQQQRSHNDNDVDRLQRYLNNSEIKHRV